MRKIACGYLCVDLYPRQGLIFIGGECANYAVAMARLGEKIELLARIGNDAIGPFLIQALEGEKIECGGIRSVGIRSGFSVVIVEGKERWFAAGGVEPYTESPMNRDDLGLDNYPTSIHLDFSSRHLLHEIKGRKNMIVSADMGRNRSRKADVFADVTFLSIPENESPEEVYLEMKNRLSENLLILTAGPRGSWAFGNGIQTHCPAPRIRVIDSTGAGDAYQGGFMAEYLRSQNVAAAMEAGTESGAKACRFLGACGIPLSLPRSLHDEWISFARSKGEGSCHSG